MPEQSHEFSAKSVEAAIEDGLRHWGVDRDRVDIEILHEGSRGLLGIGSTNARVRLTLRPDLTETKTETKAGATSIPTVTQTPVTPAVSAPSSPAAPALPEPKVQETHDVEAAEETEEEDNVLPGSSFAEHDDEDEDGDDVYEDSAMDQDEIVALAGNMLLEMVTLMGLDAQIESSLRQEPDEDEAAIYLNLVGDDLGSLIGRQGETLSSMQYLVRLMVNQKLRRWTNIVVDVEGYKERRAERLAQMALRMAAQVIETEQSVALEPMPASERRLIHIALRDHPQVYTESIGEDTRRKIQILLK